MKLIYHPDAFLEKKLKDVDIKNPGFDPKELKENMVNFKPVSFISCNKLVIPVFSPPTL